jgi:hypothetical protein
MKSERSELESLVAVTVERLTDAGEIKPDIIREALLKAKYGEHYFAPTEFGGDWCGSCSEYYLSPLHKRAV